SSYSLSTSLLRTYIILYSFFHTPRTPEISTLSLHDALPICAFPRVPAKGRANIVGSNHLAGLCVITLWRSNEGSRSGRKVITHKDRKSTRLNSSHGSISYAVFCLKKKKNKTR